MNHTNKRPGTGVTGGSEYTPETSHQRGNSNRDTSNNNVAYNNGPCELFQDDHQIPAPHGRGWGLVSHRQPPQEWEVSSGRGGRDGPSRQMGNPQVSSFLANFHAPLDSPPPSD